MYTQAKRLLDVIVAISGLIALSPVMLVVYILVYWKLGSPVIFRQMRPGLNGRPFVVYKFRTMLDQNSPDGNPLPDDQRLTPFGRLLRATSLDELPELINILKGEMSLVGPRPLLMEYLDRYTPEQARRHEVRPGVTGWAQINGRNAVDWQERLEMDVWYVDNSGFILDMKILWRTVWIVLQAKSINQPGNATMSKFRGNKP